MVKPKHAKERKAVVLFVLIGVQVALLVWVHRLTSLLRTEWPHVVKAFPSRIYVIQASHFWGPVTAIVPRRCREMDKFQKIEELASNASNLTRNSLDGGHSADEPFVSAERLEEPFANSGHQQKQSADEPFVSAERLEEPFDLAARSSTSAQILTTTPPPWKEFSKLLTTIQHGRRAFASLTSSTTTTTPSIPRQLDSTSTMASAPKMELSPPKIQLLPPKMHPNALPLLTSRMIRNSSAPRPQLRIPSSDEQRFPRELGINEGEPSIVTGHSIVVQRCNESMVFEEVGYRHQYFAMILLSNFLDQFTGGIQDTHSLQKKRVRSHYQLMVGIILCMLLKYTRVIVDTIAKQQHYMQLWNEGRTQFDKALESLLIHGVTIVYTLAMQMALCGIFLTFWRDDHFIMSFFPDVGLFLFGLTLLLFCVYNVIDRFYGYMVKCGNRYLYTFWTFWVLWTVLLTVPMIGYCVYSVDFMLRITELHWVQKEDDMFSLEFAKTSIDLGKATGVFMAVAFIDLLTLLGLDLDFL